MAMMKEWATINGNNTTSGGLVYDGLEVQITNAVDYVALGYNLDPFNGLWRVVARATREIAQAGGLATLLVLSYAARGAMQRQLMTNFFGIQQTTNQGLSELLGGGLNVKIWDFGNGELEIVPEQYIHPDAYDNLHAYVLDYMSHDNKNNGNVIQYVNLLPPSMFELGRLQSQLYRGLIMEILVLMVSIPAFQRKITSLPANLAE
jgi:hypothetical protein